MIASASIRSPKGTILHLVQQVTRRSSSLAAPRGISVFRNESKVLRAFSSYAAGSQFNMFDAPQSKSYSCPRTPIRSPTSSYRYCGLGVKEHSREINTVAVPLVEAELECVATASSTTSSQEKKQLDPADKPHDGSDIPIWTPRLTKIVATIGPTSEQLPVLQQLVDSGLRIMRLNFSHATVEEVELRMKNLKLCKVSI